jgi:hypothetical protein
MISRVVCIVVFFLSIVIECSSATRSEDLYSQQVAAFAAKYWGVNPKDINVRFVMRIPNGGIVLYKAESGTKAVAVKIESHKLTKELKASRRFLRSLQEYFRTVHEDEEYYRIIIDDFDDFEIRYNPVLVFGWLHPDGTIMGPYPADFPQNAAFLSNLTSSPGVSIQLSSWIPGLSVEQLVFMCLQDEDGNPPVEAMVDGVRRFVQVGQLFERLSIHHGDFATRNVMFSPRNSILWVIDPGANVSNLCGMLSSFKRCGNPKLHSIIPIVAAFIRSAVADGIMDYEKYCNWFSLVCNKSCLVGYCQKARCEALIRLWPLRCPFLGILSGPPEEVLQYIDQKSKKSAIVGVLRLLLLYDLLPEQVDCIKANLSYINWTERDVFEIARELRLRERQSNSIPETLAIASPFSRDAIRTSGRSATVHRSKIKKVGGR